MTETLALAGERYTFCDEVRDKPQIRAAFDALARETFGLSFESWYRAGHWSAAYVPHVLLREGAAVSCVAANLLDFSLDGARRRYVQLGTVMTAKDSRNRGLARWLMERVLERYLPVCDGLYLYANDSVTGFYPRFGFKEAAERQHSLPIPGGQGLTRRLDLGTAGDMALLRRYIRRGNPHARLTMAESESMVMFYMQFMGEDVYLIEEYDAVAVAEAEGDMLLCYDLFGGEGAELEQLAAAAAPPGARRVCFGFTPKENGGMHAAVLREADTTFFWHRAYPLPAPGQALMFPLLSRT